MNGVLALWNAMNLEQAAEAILPCCDCKAWAHAMTARRPVVDETTLLAASDEVCGKLSESDWMEAFRSHPRIGETQAQSGVLARSAKWSQQEQRRLSTADEQVKTALAKGNRAYEQRFNHIFIVCATDKSPAELLDNLQRRLRYDEVTEFREATEQQRQIAQIRLKKWLHA
jgi:2-oxo-4-hydroxy-4-carboxy-5-ureidoimidazoline decarboxylase